MSRGRLILLAVLVLAPFVFLIGVGSYHLFNTGWQFIAWWPMALSITLAYALGWYWTRPNSRMLLPGTGVDRPFDYWTDRDREAWKLVESKAAALGDVTPADIENPQKYTADAIELALAVARVYKPGAADPFGHLTLPEILACGELVSHDLTRRVNAYMPLSHVLKVNHLKQARQAIDWGQKAWNVSWLARAIVNPLKTAAQFAASKAGGSVLTRAQGNVMRWFYAAYLHELGRYLIELNSGRLKVGAKRYLELVTAHQTPPVVPDSTGAAAEAEDPDAPPVSPAAPATPAAPVVTVALVGQVKAGKSSLVNALLGEHRAATDVLPLTAGATKYELARPELPRLVLTDTAGYGAGGPSESEFEEAFRAARESDLMLFVGHARSAARKTDADLLARLLDLFASKPELRRPPILAVLTHVDLLTPAMEWTPPYDWRAGTRPKEVSMREAALAAREQFGPAVLDVLPVCGSPERLFGLADGLVPAMAAHMDHARGAALLRVFHAEGSADAGKKAVRQVLNVGREAAKLFWENMKKG